MSTDRTLHQDGRKEVSFTDSGGRYDLDLMGYGMWDDEDVLGPQNMNPDEALAIAAGIIYSVWTSYDHKAEEFVRCLHDIPETWRVMQEQVLNRIPLTEMKKGQKGVVDIISGSVVRLQEMGLNWGTEVEMLQPGNPCIIQVGDTKLAINTNHILILVKLT